MLLELLVRNLVIVAEARLCPGEGLCAITGETGAGKSLLLDALGLLVGERGSPRLIGGAGDAAEVCGVFEVPPAIVASIHEICGVDCPDRQVVLRRRLTSTGRSQAWINDTPVGVAALRRVGAELVEIRSQHEHLQLAEPARQLAILDGFGGHLTLAADYRAAHAAVLAAEAELARLDSAEADSLRERDFCRFQLDEFEALDPQPGELAELDARQRLLASAQEWRDLCAAAGEALSEGERSVLPQLSRFARRLADAPDARLQEAASNLLQATEFVRDAAGICLDAGDRLHVDAGELARIDERLSNFQQLLRKHGGNEAALLEARDRLRARVDELEHLDERRLAAVAARASALAERQRLGESLAEARRRAALALAGPVHAQLAELAMPKARLSLADESAEPGPLGLRRQELLIAANPGLPPAPLGAVASGGESARIVLALSAVLADRLQTPVIVFDEVDSGVGGRLGARLGDALAKLASGRTVLAVTHTPQLAAMAGRHVVVRKMHGEESTQVVVETVAGSERLDEIAAMLGGGAAAVAQAGVLLGHEVASVPSKAAKPVKPAKTAKTAKAAQS